MVKQMLRLINTFWGYLLCFIGALASLVTIIYCEPFRAWLKSLWKWFSASCTDISTRLSATHQATGWNTVYLWTLALVSMALLSFLLVIALRNRWKRIGPLDYTQDTFFDVIWTWTNGFMGDGVRDLTARCPHCGMILRYEEPDRFSRTFLTWFCIHCGFKHSYDVTELTSDRLMGFVRDQIDRKLHTGDYRAAVRQFRN